MLLEELDTHFTVPKKTLLSPLVPLDSLAFCYLLSVSIFSCLRTFIVVLHTLLLQGRYDFFYLPIDPRNKCNVGYVFDWVVLLVNCYGCSCNGMCCVGMKVEAWLAPYGLRIIEIDGYGHGCHSERKFPTRVFWNWCVFCLLCSDYGSYAFVNFIDYKHTVHFHNLYDDKRWKHFQSEKVTTNLHLSTILPLMFLLVQV